MTTIPTLTGQQKYDIGVAANLAYLAVPTPRDLAASVKAHTAIVDTVLAELAELTPTPEPATDPRVDPRPWEGPLTDPCPEVGKGDAVRVKVDGSWFESIAHHQDEDGDWFTEDGVLIEWSDALAVHRIPAPAPDLPERDGAIIIPAEGCEYIEAKVGGLTYIAREAIVCRSMFGPQDVLEGAWRTSDDSIRAGGQVGREFIVPGTWQEVQA